VKEILFPAKNSEKRKKRGFTTTRTGHDARKVKSKKLKGGREGELGNHNKPSNGNPTKGQKGWGDRAIPSGNVGCQGGRCEKIVNNGHIPCQVPKGIENLEHLVQFQSGPGMGAESRGGIGGKREGNLSSI